MTQLGTAVKKAGSKRRREHDRQVLRSGEMDQIKVSYTAGGSQALGIVSAQQRLLAAILREPQYLDLVKDQLTAEQFIQPQQKELYEAMLRCREQGVEISLTALRAFAGEEALNELSHLAAQYSDVNCTPDDIRLYLDRIARGMPVASKAASMTNEELSELLPVDARKKAGARVRRRMRPAFPSGWSRRGKEQESCRNCRRPRNWPGRWRHTPGARP